MADPYSMLDVWEALKAHVLEAAPSLASRLAECPGEPWRNVTAAEAQVLAAMVFLGLDERNPPLRRKARVYVRELIEFQRGSEAANFVRENTPDLGELLSEAGREKLLRACAWIEKEPPARWLAGVSGPQAAIKHVHKHAAALGGLRANRWLAALGFPMAVPDNARQRFLQRIGWRPGADSTNRGRAEALAFLEGVAREVAAPLGEVNQVLEAFTGAGDEVTRPAACCLAAPRCSHCPVRPHCAYFKAEGKRADATSRSFAATTRREQRPRERLQREGAEALTDEELLAIVLRTGSGRENALDLARRILRHAGTLERVASMSIAELSRFHGLGRVKAITVKAALEMARRVRDTTGFSESGRLDAARKVFELLRPQFVGAKKEEFHVLLLNTKLEITRQVRVSTGTLNQSLVHPREVFTEAVRDSAYAVVFVHNHPSGDPEPSRDDFAVTAKLVKAGEVVGVRVLDHIIMGRDAFFSFAEEGKLNA